MPIVVVCACGRQLQAKDELAGKRVRCPQCGQPVAIPVPRAPAVRPAGRSPPASGGRPGSTPAARAPSGSTDLFGDLSSLESAAANPLSGHLPPGGNPLAGPMGGVDQPQPRKRGPNPIMLVGAVGGGVALVILGILIVALLTRDKGVPDEPVAAKPSEKEPSREARVEKPQPEKPVASAPVPPPTPAETAVSPSTAADTAATTAPPKVTAPVERTWIELAPALASRLGKPEPLKGVTVIDAERSLIAGYSWMTHLLPYMGEEQRYQKFNFTKPWSDKVNLQLTGPVEAFLNPADPREAWEGWPYDGIGLTHFVGISGIEETRNDVAALLPRSDPKAGMFGYEEIARPGEITDGTSQTLMLMGSGALAAPWVQGGGATIRGLREPYFDELTGFGSKGAAEGGTLVMFADGSAKTLSTKISPQVLRNLATIRGADPVDRSQLEEMVK